MWVSLPVGLLRGSAEGSSLESGALEFGEELCRAKPSRGPDSPLGQEDEGMVGFLFC